MTPELVQLHQWSDAFIALSYYAIPLFIIIVALKRREIVYSAHGRLFVWLFAVFIILCGTTHICEIILLYNPIYSFAGWLKLATAVMSVVTSVYFVRRLPILLDLQKRREHFDQLSASMIDVDDAQDFMMKFTRLKILAREIDDLKNADKVESINGGRESGEG